LRRIPRNQTPGPDIAFNDAADGQHSITAHDNASNDQDLGRDPHAIFDVDSSNEEIKVGRTVVVASRAQVSSLRNADMVAYAHICQIVYPYILADPTVSSDVKFPRIFDAYERLQHHASANSGAKQPQYPYLGS